MLLRLPDGDNAVSLSVRGLTVRSGGRAILEDITLSLPRGQRLALLGPPSAGKTALLLAIAGLLPLAQGTVLTDGRDITDIRPAARGIGLALAAPPPGRFAGRRVRRLAVADSHGLVLLDRPDAWPAGGGTAVAALADQVLALSGADRLAILRDGRMAQEGPAASVYENPRSAFVARFLGGANIIAGTVREVRPGRFVLVAEGLRMQLVAAPDAPRPALGSRLTLALRPERIALLFADESADNVATGVVAGAVFQGASVLLGVDTPAGRIDVRLPGWRADQAPAPGATVRLGWAADAAVPVLED
jgi:ABC-type Fe3+/spermidine/putrescine transport system ATPase subunit